MVRYCVSSCEYEHLFFEGVLISSRDGGCREGYILPFGKHLMNCDPEFLLSSDNWFYNDYLP